MNIILFDGGSERVRPPWEMATDLEREKDEGEGEAREREPIVFCRGKRWGRADAMGDGSES